MKGMRRTKVGRVAVADTVADAVADTDTVAVADTDTDADACNSHRSLAQADLLLLLARMLSAPPLEEISARDLDRLARAAAAAPRRLAPALRGTLAVARRTEIGAWRDERTLLFDGALRCPVNETAYIRRDKGQIIADLCGFYRAFGFAPREGCGEKPDHLVTELEFVAIVLVMLARAETAAQRATCRVALRSFMRDHLGDWLPLFRDRLAAVADLPLFVRIADLVPHVWDAVAAAHALPAFATLSAPTAREDGLDDASLESPYECGMVSEEHAGASQLVPLTLSRPSGPRGGPFGAAHP
jgi:nitrate reductase assembly molybdenum cofactor insertion protein NarJ